MARKIAAADREVPGNTPATTCARPTPTATFQVTVSRSGRRAAKRSASEDQRPAYRGDGFRQLPAGHAYRQADRRGHQERGGQLEHVIAVARFVQAGGQRPQPLPEHQGDGEDGAGLDDDVEEVRAVAQPAFGDQQVAGAGNGEEFGEAFEDAKQQSGNRVGHEHGRANDRQSIEHRRACTCMVRDWG